MTAMSTQNIHSCQIIEVVGVKKLKIRYSSALFSFLQSTSIECGSYLSRTVRPHQQNLRGQYTVNWPHNCLTYKTWWYMGDICVLRYTGISGRLERLGYLWKIRNLGILTILVVFFFVIIQNNLNKMNNLSFLSGLD